MDDATNTKETSVMDILDMPKAYDNAGRELRVLAAVQGLTGLTRQPISFGRGLQRTRTWRISGIAEADIAAVTAAVWAIVPSATFYPKTCEMEWHNL